MTGIERKALALVNEVRVRQGYIPCADVRHGTNPQIFSAFLLAIEQHEAFRQEVSDAVELRFGRRKHEYGCLGSFIIAKPDPLVEALDDLKDGRAGPTTESYAACLRAAIEARGGRIVWEGE